MAEKFASKRNIKFMIYEVFNAAELTRHEFFRDHNPETYNMIIDTIWKMAWRRKDIYCSLIFLFQS
jgi:hypothetical protein